MQNSGEKYKSCCYEPIEKVQGNARIYKQNRMIKSKSCKSSLFL